MYYGARWYDPYLNHITQPDTIVPDPSNSQDWDRFSYVMNNPIRYTDPSGHDVQCTLEDGCWETCDYNCDISGTSSGGSSGGSDEEDVIIACGFGAGGNCDNTEGYDGVPLSPYYQLGTPLIYGVDSYSDPKKLNMAIEIYNYIKNNPGEYILVGHSAGGTALVIVANMLQKEGLGDQIAALVPLNPYFNIDYLIDQQGGLEDIQDVANELAPDGLPVFLGDSSSRWRRLYKWGD